MKYILIGLIAFSLNGCSSTKNPGEQTAGSSQVAKALAGIGRMHRK